MTTSMSMLHHPWSWVPAFAGTTEELL